MTHNFPKIIHQIWFDFKDLPNIPEHFNKNVESWKNHNPDWDYKVWDLETAVKIIKDEYPGYLNTFNEFKYNISKCDFFRYILMNKYGGMYIDLDFLCIRPINYFLDLLEQNSINKLNESVDTSIVLTEEWPNSSKKKNINILGSSGTFHNGLLISKPEHPFWLLLAEQCTHESLKIDGDQNTVFSITGTIAIWNAYEKYNNKFNDIVVLPNYYFCPLGCKFKNTNLLGFPEQDEYLPNTLEWGMLSADLCDDISHIRHSIPWSFSILIAYKSTWKE